MPGSLARRKTAWGSPMKCNDEGRMSETNGTESCELKAAECEHIAAKMPDEPFRRIYLDLAAKWRERAQQITALQRRRSARD